MSNAAIVAIVIGVLIVLAGLVVFATARRADARSATGNLSRETKSRDRSASTTSESGGTQGAGDGAVTGKDLELASAAARTAVAVAPKATPAPYVPMDPDQLGVTRRQFLNRANATMLGVSLSGFGGAVLAFLWPSTKGGFGSKITVGKVEDVAKSIRDGQGFLYVPEGRTWLTAYPVEGLTKARRVYKKPVIDGMEKGGVVALYQKCVHLGCRVPQCVTSQWFECPCHGSQYNRAGEKKAGPAPRGLDRFAVEVNNGLIVVNTGLRFDGPPIGTNTTGQEAEGPHCVGGGEGKH
jgi:cytochrome b6-f complex iron-sulfur subunit